ncbi:MAG: hypothetical protein WCL08_01025 [Verrucomicrobiota bacterium]
MKPKPPPYQQRVIDEKKELDARLAKLTAFLTDPAERETVTDMDRELLEKQQDAMTAYSRVLGLRVRSFPAPAVKPESYPCAECGVDGVFVRGAICPICGGE